MARVHGTRAMYREGKCRCVECRAWNAAAKREYDARFKAREGISVTQKYRPAISRRAPGECSECGKRLTGTTLPDPVCARCRGNKPGYHIKITRPARLAIYERDEWTCTICLEAVDRELPAKDTWAATLDHIVPRARAGSDDPSNLRLAHRWCNSVRGDLRFHTDDDLRVA